MDAAEYVVSVDDRMALAALALDSLSDAISDDAILHLIATLDSEADVQLLVQTGQEVLEALLHDPVARGQQIGSFVDAVTDPTRLERTVARNDEVSDGVVLFLPLVFPASPGRTACDGACSVCVTNLLAD